MQPPIPEWNDQPQVGFCINVEWATFVSGLLARGEGEKYWDLDAERGAQGIRHIQEVLFGAICGGVDVPTRLVIASHERPNNTPGGAILLGWNTTDLSTLEGLDLTGFSLSSGNVFIPPGSYEFWAWQVLYRPTINYNARLAVVFFNPVVNRYGMSVSMAVAGVPVFAVCAGAFVTVGQTGVAMQLYSSAASAGTGSKGTPANIGQPETYGQLILRYHG